MLWQAGKWAATTLGAALLGSVVTTVHNSARPAVTVVEIAPSLTVNKFFVGPKVEVSVPPGLKNTAEKSIWAATSAFREALVPYRSFVAALDDNERRMTRLLRSLGRFNADLTRMRELLDKGERASPEDKLAFFDLWERNDAFIYGSLQGQFIRGEIELVTASYKGRPFFRLEELEEDGLPVWRVAKRAGRYASYMGPRRRSDETFRKEVAYALAFFDTGRLGEYLRYVQRDTKEDEAARQVNGEIQTARTGLSRWAVTVLIGNSGSSPLAFLPAAELVVDTRGLIHNGVALADETVISLERREAKGQTKEPDRDSDEGGGESEPAAVQVPGGSAVLVVFASKEFIGEHPRGETLSKAYLLGGKDFYVRLRAVGGGLFARDAYATARMKFSPAGSTAAR
jgi:hypothetical protein